MHLRQLSWSSSIYNGLRFRILGSGFYRQGYAREEEVCTCSNSRPDTSHWGALEATRPGRASAGRIATHSITHSVRRCRPCSRRHPQQRLDIAEGYAPKACPRSDST